MRIFLVLFLLCSFSFLSFSADDENNDDDTVDEFYRSIMYSLYPNDSSLPSSASFAHDPYHHNSNNDPPLATSSSSFPAMTNPFERQSSFSSFSSFSTTTIATPSFNPNLDRSFSSEHSHEDEEEEEEEEESNENLSDSDSDDLSDDPNFSADFSFFPRHRRPRKPAIKTSFESCVSALSSPCCSQNCIYEVPVKEIRRIRLDYFQQSNERARSSWLRTLL